MFIKINKNNFSHILFHKVDRYKIQWMQNKTDMYL